MVLSDLAGEGIDDSEPHPFQWVDRTGDQQISGGTEHGRGQRVPTNGSEISDSGELPPIQVPESNRSPSRVTWSLCEIEWMRECPQLTVTGKRSLVDLGDTVASDLQSGVPPHHHLLVHSVYHNTAGQEPRIEDPLLGVDYFEFAPFSCKFSFLVSYSFLLISWVNCHQIENFQCLNISPGREEFRTHLGFILSPL